MAKVIKSLSEADEKALKELLEAHRGRFFNARGRGAAVPEDPQAPDIYVAQTPSGGIPGRTGAGVTGTGTGVENTVPGEADCDIYRIVGLPDSPKLVQVIGLTKRVYNLSESAVPGDVLLLIARDKFGQWWVAEQVDDGGASGMTPIRVLDVTLTQTEDCISENCPLYYHYARIQEFDEDCGRWMNSRCVIAADVDGRRLEPGKVYLAKYMGDAPNNIETVAAPVGFECPTDVSQMDLYVADIGDPTRTIHVIAEHGRLCGDAAGTGTGTQPDDLAQNLLLYTAEAERWNPSTCQWEVIEEDLYVAEMHGCELEPGKRYAGHYESLVSTLSGTSSGVVECRPLYLVDHLKELKEGVSDILCVNGVLKVYTWQPINDCNDVVSTYSHDAGCCECGDAGTGTGGGCPCDVGVPTATTFRASTFALTNGTCTSPGCSVFPATFDLTKHATLLCTWNSNTLGGPCGGSLGATLEVDSAGATLIIGSFPTATYSMSGAFACNGVNTLDLVSNDGGCANWPASVTLTPV